MNKHLARCLLTLAVLGGIFIARASASDPFEGRMKMQMDTGGSEKTMIAYAIKGQRLRMEMGPSDQKQIISLLDWEKREMSMLMPGQTMYMVLELKDVPVMNKVDQARETTTLEKTSETAVIMGHQTTKYIARDGKNVTDLWLASGLGTWFNMAGGSPTRPKKLTEWEKEVIAQGLFPLRMVTYDKGGKPKMHMEVVELTPQKLDDALFVPPPGYTRFSMGGILKGLTGARN